MSLYYPSGLDNFSVSSLLCPLRLLWLHTLFSLPGMEQMFTIPSLGLRGKWLASRAYSQYIFNRTFPEPLAWLEYTSGAEAAEVWSIFLALSIPGHSSLLLASRVCLPRMLGVYHGTNLNWQEWCPKEQPRSMTAGTWGINRPTPYFLISNNSPRSHQWDETPRVQWELPWHTFSCCPGSISLPDCNSFYLP